MLKEKRNQGMIALVIISIFFLGGAGIFGFMLYSNYHPSQAYAGDSTKAGGSDPVYADIYNISEQALIEVDDNTEVWLIQYQDGYAGLQAKKNDPQVADILKKAQSGELTDSPVRISARLISSQSKTEDRISNYSSLIRSVGADFEDVTPYLADDTYLSLSEYQSDNFQYIFFLIFLLGFFVFFVIIGLLARKRNIAAYDEIYTAYPEVKGNLNLLMEQADFHDDVLKIIVYKHHLITYYNGFKAVDLSETVQLYHHILTMHRGFTSNRNSSLIAIRPNKKKYTMPIKNINKTTDSKLQSTFDYIYTHFPHVKLGV